ncbi:MAG: hypothetical protein LRZ99_07665 [Desulfotomaculum sp.]|nr:hypothetical protein [Desulfotomaculum sp.]
MYISKGVIKKMDDDLKKDIQLKEDQTLLDDPETKRQIIKWQKPVLIFLAVILWGGMIYGAAYYAQQYIDQSIQSVQQTNAMNVRNLEERLNVLATDMQEIKQILQDTDQVLGGTEDTQQALNNKIAALDKQLQELERSLHILKEAP